MMGRRSTKPGVAHVSSEAEQQCVVREANEAISVLHAALAAGAQRLALRCECGDAGCVACVSLTRAEYEAVRAYGSRFAVGVNHENPEDACVLSQTAQFQVIDVIGGDSRYHVLARNPRHAWSEGSDS
jgi:ferredoxin